MSAGFGAFADLVWDGVKRKVPNSPEIIARTGFRDWKTLSDVFSSDRNHDPAASVRAAVGSIVRELNKGCSLQNMTLYSFMSPASTPFSSPKASQPQRRSLSMSRKNRESVSTDKENPAGPEKMDVVEDTSRRDKTTIVSQREEASEPQQPFRKRSEKERHVYYPEGGSGDESVAAADVTMTEADPVLETLTSSAEKLKTADSVVGLSAANEVTGVTAALSTNSSSINGGAVNLAPGSTAGQALDNYGNSCCGNLVLHILNALRPLYKNNIHAPWFRELMADAAARASFIRENNPAVLLHEFLGRIDKGEDSAEYMYLRECLAQLIRIMDKRVTAEPLLHKHTSRLQQDLILALRYFIQQVDCAIEALYVSLPQATPLSDTDLPYITIQSQCQYKCCTTITDRKCGHEDTASEADGELFLPINMPDGLANTVQAQVTAGCEPEDIAVEAGTAVECKTCTTHNKKVKVDSKRVFELRKVGDVLFIWVNGGCVDGVKAKSSIKSGDDYLRLVVNGAPRIIWLACVGVHSGTGSTHGHYFGATRTGSGDWLWKNDSTSTVVESTVPYAASGYLYVYVDASWLNQLAQAVPNAQPAAPPILTVVPRRSSVRVAAGTTEEKMKAVISDLMSEVDSDSVTMEVAKSELSKTLKMTPAELDQYTDLIASVISDVQSAEAEALEMLQNEDYESLEGDGKSSTTATTDKEFLSGKTATIGDMSEEAKANEYERLITANQFGPKELYVRKPGNFPTPLPWPRKGMADMLAELAAEEAAAAAAPSP